MEKVHSQLHSNGSKLEQTFEVDWTSLPQEIWLKIFGYLPQSELYLNVFRVCRVWNDLCRDVSLWRRIDFDKLHEDLENQGYSNLPEKHFINILEVFCHSILSVKLSRFNADLRIYNRTFISVSMCANLQSLDIGFLDDIDLTMIFSNCKNLENLSLEGCSQLQDSDFDMLKLLQKLKRLCVNHCVSLTSYFLCRLYELPNLRALNCDGVTSIRGSGLVNFLHRQPLLEELVLDGEELGDVVVEFVASLLPNLRVFELSFSESLTICSIYAFQGKYRLESFKLGKACDVNCSALPKVFSPSATFNLKHFTITECSLIDDNALNALSRSCPHLKALVVDWCYSITDRGVADIVNNCKNMAHMSLVGLTIKGEGWLDKLEIRLPRLVFMDLSSCDYMPDDELVDLVRRNGNIDVYTYYHEKVVVGLTESSETNNNAVNKRIEIWKCPGEDGAEVVF